MSKFLNFENLSPFDKKTLILHIKSFFLWFILGGWLFRVDEFVFESFYSVYPFLRYIVFVLLCVVVVGVFVKSQWYFILIVIFYPFLIIFWFLPKFIFYNFKLLVFYEYIITCLNWVIHWRRFVFKIVLLSSSFFVFEFLNSKIAYLFLFSCASYFYWPYFFKFFFNRFKKDSSLDYLSLDKKFHKLLSSYSFDKSLSKILYIYPEDSANINKVDKSKKVKFIKNNESIERTIISLKCLESIRYDLSGSKISSSYSYFIVFKIFSYLFISLIYFWICNLTLYIVDDGSFIYKNDSVGFDFFYYTFKGLTFGDIELIKPNSTLARIIEMISFFFGGILGLIYLISVFVNIKHEEFKERVNYFIRLIDLEHKIVDQFLSKKLRINIDDYLLKHPDFEIRLKKALNFVRRLL
ncbi:hypothetical protein [Algoriphagus sp. PAP.12]|uniref:hypothetical protein n=1 Tax=Algoriphagus sp. PAP.12 TaxID=2996678 RepID=UPI00227D0DD2|nr:hypothetical protein [Algoriphagus sp. PAP.12]